MALVRDQEKMPPPPAAAGGRPLAEAHLKRSRLNGSDRNQNGMQCMDGKAHGHSHHQERLEKSQKSFPVSSSSSSSWTLHVQIQPISWILFALSFLLRAVHIDHPRDVVFDEVHYSRFISLYLRRTFFFDTQPPLGKQLYAAVGWLSNYDGSSNISSIGSEYDQNFPVSSLRLFSAVTGSLVVPILYNTLLSMGCSGRASVAVAAFVALDNSYITQSRYILMDMPQLFVSALSYYLIQQCLARQPHTSGHYAYFGLSIFCASLSASIKYSGFSTVLLVGCLTAIPFWADICDRTKVSSTLVARAVAYSLLFLAIPLAVYTSVFYIHLNVLTQAGPHDQVLSSRFQASLSGGLASIFKGQPLVISHGSQVTLRHTHGRACWLHSHDHLYPVKYPDGRGSSHQQQVTCYSFKDVFNWWIVKRPNSDEEDLSISSYNIDPIRNGDVIQLIHGMSGRALNSHDVTAPMSPYKQEVSCYIDYNISMAAQSHWKVLLLNPAESDHQWHAVTSRVKLIHLNSSQALSFSGKQYPDWGFHQHEVATDRETDHEDTVWNVEEHRYGKANDGDDPKERELDLVKAEFVPTAPVQLSFWQKFGELQWKMLPLKDLMEDHLFSSESPLDWPLLHRGIAYWISRTSNAQIYLIGNLPFWYLANLAVFLNLLINSWYLLRRRRRIYDIDEVRWNQFSSQSLGVFISYLVHFLPYFLIETNYFLYQYLVPFYFQCILLALTLDHLFTFLPYHVCNTVLISAFAAIVHFFLKYFPFTCGAGAHTAEQISSLRWKESWNLLIPLSGGKNRGIY